MSKTKGYQVYYQFITRVFFLGIVALAFLFVTATKLDRENPTIKIVKPLNIQLSEFSPAYAALEDEYLFVTQASTPLIGGVEDGFYLSQINKYRKSKAPLSIREWIGITDNSDSAQNSNVIPSALAKGSSTVRLKGQKGERAFAKTQNQKVATSERFATPDFAFKIWSHYHERSTGDHPWWVCSRATPWTKNSGPK